MDLIDQVLHLRLLLCDDIYDLCIRRLIRDQVANADTVCMSLHIFSDNILESIDEVGRGNITEIITDTLDQTDTAPTKDALVDLTAHHSPIPDFNYIIGCRVVLVGVLLAKRLFLVLQCQWRQDLREDIEIADILTALE